MQWLKAIEDEQRPPLAGELGQPPAFVERALRTARHRQVAEEGQGFLQKDVGRRRDLFSRALAVEGPRKRRVAPRPILIREVRRPIRDERGLPLAAKGDEGENVRALAFVVLGLRPGLVEEPSFGVPADE